MVLRMADAIDRFYGVIPAGGVGSRLWPLSRAEAPKFLHDVVGNGSTLLRATWDRLAPLCAEDRLLVVTGEAHAKEVRAQLPELIDENIVLESEGRESTAAIGLAAAILQRRVPDAIIGSFAADHLIGATDRFAAAVREAVEAADAGAIVTIGIQPIEPSTAFGYIRAGKPLSIPAAPSARKVDAFVEKPKEATARRYLASGEYLWNAGMFFARVDRLMEALAESNPVLAAGINEIADAWGTDTQAAFLAGYLAAGVSKTGVVGTFGGGNQPPVTVFMDGFAAGVEQYNTAKGASVRVVGWDPKTQQGSFTDDFTNTNAAQTTAQGLISQGADIIMPVAAQAGEGAAAAALAAGDVGIIWVDSDGYELLGEEYRPLLVTTVEKRMEPAILGVIGADIDGTFEAGNNVGTLENDGVGLSSFHDWDSKVPAELKSEIEDLKAKIISGEIVVESPSSPTGAN